MSVKVQDSNNNGNEFVFTVDGIFEEKAELILIESVRQQDQLRVKGFGEKIKEKYMLESYEALFLIHIKRLILEKKSKILEFSELLQILLKKDPAIFTKFLIYRDLRVRGYVAKEGFGFGNDFRVYERGEYTKKPAKYVVFGLNEGLGIKTGNLYENIDSIEKMGKEGIIAVIERRGEIIYYKINKKRFDKNEKFIINNIKS